MKWTFDTFSLLEITMMWKQQLRGWEAEQSFLQTCEPKRTSLEFKAIWKKSIEFGKGPRWTTIKE